jgi:xylulokinase
MRAVRNGPDQLFCGIDIGSTNVKVLLIDDGARTLWSRSIPVPRIDQEGRPATDAKALVGTLEQLIVEGWRATESSSPIVAIATAGIGEDGLPVDAQLAPLDVAIPWFDRRAQSDADALRPLLDEPARAGVPMDGTRTAAKWRWLRQHRPQALRDAHAWIALTDYPAVWWSRATFISETLAARTGCYDVFDRHWLPRHLEAAGAPALPPVARAGAVVGTVVSGTLLDSGAASRSTLIVAGGHDHPLAASVVHRIEPGAIVDSLGTANLVYGEATDVTPRCDRYIAFSVPALGGSGVACLGVYEFAASLASTSSADDGASLRACLAAGEAAGEPGQARPILGALRHSLGIHAPCDDGAPPAGDPRSLVEAACFYARRMLDTVRATGAGSGRVYSVGGWARSRALLRLRASVLGVPLVTLDEEELTALGAALVARDAGQVDRAASLRREARVVDPHPAWQAHYERMYPQVRQALEAWHVA